MVKKLRLDYEWIYDDSDHGDKIWGSGWIDHFSILVLWEREDRAIYLGNCQSN